MIYKKNVDALIKIYGAYYKRLEDNDFCNILNKSVNVEKAKNGEPILNYTYDGNSIYLNSRYNPSNEAEKYMEPIKNMKDKTVLMMFGISNGSFLREYLKHGNENTKCIVYEPCTEIFIELIKNVDITDIIESDRVYIGVKDISEELFKFSATLHLHEYNKDLNIFISAPKYAEMFQEDFRFYWDMIKDIYERQWSVTNTAIEYGKRTVVNSIRNMNYLEGSRTGSDLVNAFPSDMTAIIVSAGPSLEKNVALLKEAKGKALIISVDSAVVSVLEAGIIPDMIITVDPIKPLNRFENLNIEKIPFLVDMDSNYEVLDYVKPENLFFISSDSVIWSNLYKTVGKNIDNLEQGGSVATAAIACTIFWGIKRIVLIGQDLTFTDYKTHSNSDYTEKIGNEDEFFTIVKDVNGQDQLIRKDYYLYLRWIEEIAYRFQDIDFIDATEGGSKKKNLRVMTLKEVIDVYCNEVYDIDKIINNVPRLFLNDDKKYIVDMVAKMKNDFKKMKRQLTGCMADCRYGKRILENKELNIKELKRINKQIEKTDNMIEDCDERILIYKYIALAETEFQSDMLMEEEDHIKESIRMYEKSENYYASIVSVLPELIDMLDECLDKLQGGEYVK